MVRSESPALAGAVCIAGTRQGYSTRLPFRSRRIGRLARLLLGSALALLLSAGESSASVELTPTDSVKKTVSELIEILDDQKLNLPDQFEERRRRIERTLKTRINCEEMAARSLGTPWAELTQKEQHEFVDLFVQFLSKSLAAWKFERGPFDESMVANSDEMVTYLSEQQQKGFSEVRTKVRSQKVDTLLDFRLVKHSGNWRVYDIVIDKVSLDDNYRAQFKSVTRYISYAGLENKIHKLLPILKLFEQLVPR